MANSPYSSSGGVMNTSGNSPAAASTPTSSTPTNTSANYNFPLQQLSASVNSLDPLNAMEKTLNEQLGLSTTTCNTSLSQTTTSITTSQCQPVSSSTTTTSSNSSNTNNVSS